jgi:hypothetical protein
MYLLGYRLGFFTSANSGENLCNVEKVPTSIEELCDSAQFITGYYAGYNVNAQLLETAEHDKVIVGIYGLIKELP